MKPSHLIRTARRTSCVAILLFGMLAAGHTYAQEMPSWAAPSYSAPPPAEMAPDLPGDPPPLPIDGGALGLALVGIGYAIRRLRRHPA